MSDALFLDVATLGELTDAERAEFYDALADDLPGQNLFGLGSDAKVYENPTLRPAFLLADGRLVPVAEAPGTTLADTKIDVVVERYFVRDMPGNNFELQLVVSARHLFSNRKEAEEVAHTLAVKGVRNDWVNYLAEPVFQGLVIKDSLSLNVMVNFVGDKMTDALLTFMDSEVAKKGIQLAGSYNPIFGTAASYCRSIVAGVLKAHKNQAITNMNLTLSGARGPMALPLVEGTYLLVQPLRGEVELTFTGMHFDAPTGRFLASDKPLERNHLVLRIAKSLN
jgi:hypothetical protein